MTSTSMALSAIASAPRAITTRSGASAVGRDASHAHAASPTAIAFASNFIVSAPTRIKRHYRKSRHKGTCCGLRQALERLRNEVVTRGVARTAGEDQREYASCQCKPREGVVLRLPRPQRQGDRHAQRQHLLFRRAMHAGDHNLRPDVRIIGGSQL